MMKMRYEDSDYAQVPKNVYNIDDQTDYVSNGETIDIDAEVAKSGNDYRKMVLGYNASGTALPFSDGVFDAYVSPLVLQLIYDPKK